MKMKTFIIISGIALGILAVCIRHRQPNKHSKQSEDGQPTKQANQASPSIIDRIKSFFEINRQSLAEENQPEFVEILRITDVVYYFQSLQLRKGHDIPFIANAKHPVLQSMLNISTEHPFAIFVGTYNEDTDNIENYRLIEANEIDNEIQNFLKEEPLVVLE